MSVFRRRLLMDALARNTVIALSERLGHAGTDDDPIPYTPADGAVQQEVLYAGRREVSLHEGQRAGVEI